MNQENQAAPKRVLIYRLGSLGDTLVALPALHLVARSFPQAERRLLSEFSISEKAAPISALLDGTGLVSGYMRYPRGIRDPLQLVGLMREIRAWKPDLLVYLKEPLGKSKALRDAAFFKACGVPRIIGLPLAKDLQVPQLTGPGRYEHKAQRLARSISALGDARLEDLAAWDLHLSAAECQAAASVLQPLAGSAGLIAASIGAKVDAKDWGDDNWTSLLELLAARLPGWGLVMLGAPVERERSEGLLRHWPGEKVNLCGAVSLRESAAVIQACGVYVGHDSGPMHLAAAVGTPTVAIFSARNLPGEWFPYGPRHRVFYNQVECFGCRLDRCVEQRKKCILSIAPRDVAAAITSSLAPGLQPHPASAGVS